MRKDHHYKICEGKLKSNHPFTIESIVYRNLNSKSLNSPEARAMWDTLVHLRVRNHSNFGVGQ